MRKKTVEILSIAKKYDNHEIEVDVSCLVTNTDMALERG